MQSTAAVPPPNPENDSSHFFAKSFRPRILCWLRMGKIFRVGKQKGIFSSKIKFTELELKTLSFRGPNVSGGPLHSIEVMQAVYNEPFLFLADNKALTSIVFPLLIIKKRRPRQTRARSRQSELKNVKYFSSRNSVKPKYYVSIKANTLSKI